MRILHIIQRFGGGGRERRMVQLVRELSHKPDVEQAALVYPAEIQYQEIKDTGLKIYNHSAHGHWTRFQEIKRVIKEFAPDIVHSWSDTPLELIALPLLKNALGYHYIAGFVADGNKIPLCSSRGMAMHYTFWFADAIVSNSKAGIIAKNTPRKKSHVIYNGFDFQRIKFDVDKEAKKRELGISSRYIVTMVARVTKAKDWQSFIETAEKAEKDGLNVSFLAVGDGNQLEEDRALVNRKGLHNIQFTGRRSDVEEILQIADVSILYTSEVHAEGVSNSIMEAMAAGIPVIATDGGGTPEIITEGLNGYIVPLHGVDQAYKLLKDLLNDDSQRRFIGNSARKHVQQNFLLSRMGDDYMTLYNNLLDK